MEKCGMDFGHLGGPHILLTFPLFLKIAGAELTKLKREGHFLAGLSLTSGVGDCHLREVVEPQKLGLARKSRVVS